MSNETLGFYEANAAEYAVRSRTNPRLSAFLRRCKPGGKILELGTGSGLDARAMIDAGFIVDATDGSSQLAAAAEKVTGQPVRVILFQELAADQQYDAVYANASLLHVPRTELIDVIRRVHSALKEGGVVWASFKAGSAEGSDDLGRYYNYLGPAELLEHWSAAASWKEIELDSWQGSGFDQRPTEWLAVTAAR